MSDGRHRRVAAWNFESYWLLNLLVTRGHGHGHGIFMTQWFLLAAICHVVVGIPRHTPVTFETKSTDLCFVPLYLTCLHVIGIYITCLFTLLVNIFTTCLDGLLYFKSVHSYWHIFICPLRGRRLSKKTWNVKLGSVVSHKLSFGSLNMLTSHSFKNPPHRIRLTALASLKFYEYGPGCCCCCDE